jgi:V/A-type H+-transporting ATPase subunit D
MAKLKLTKNEQKKQKDDLKRFQRYLPTLILKKQQLQAEIRMIEGKIGKLHQKRDRLNRAFEEWSGVFAEEGVFTPGILKVTSLITGEDNIAGVTVPVFESVDFETAEYDLVRKPLWLDSAVAGMKDMISVDLELRCLEQQQNLLRREMQTTSQRVNLFEKIKIPQAQSNIKRIAVFLGDQQTAAVVRGKISKRNMENIENIEDMEYLEYLDEMEEREESKL